MSQDISSPNFVDDFVKECSRIKLPEETHNPPDTDFIRTTEFDFEKFKQGSAIFTKWLGENFNFKQKRID